MLVLQELQNYYLTKICNPHLKKIKEKNFFSKAWQVVFEFRIYSFLNYRFCPYFLLKMIYREKDFALKFKPILTFRIYSTAILIYSYFLNIESQSVLSD